MKATRKQKNTLRKDKALAEEAGMEFGSREYWQKRAEGLTKLADGAKKELFAGDGRYLGVPDLRVKDISILEETAYHLAQGEKPQANLNIFLMSDKDLLRLVEGILAKKVFPTEEAYWQALIAPSLKMIEGKTEEKKVAGGKKGEI